MGKSISKAMREKCISDLSSCIGKECKIVKEVIGKEYGKFESFDPTAKNKFLFKLNDSEYEKLLVCDGIFIYFKK